MKLNSGIDWLKALRDLHATPWQYLGMGSLRRAIGIPLPAGAIPLAEKEAAVFDLYVDSEEYDEAGEILLEEMASADDEEIGEIEQYMAEAADRELEEMGLDVAENLADLRSENTALWARRDQLRAEQERLQAENEQLARQLIDQMEDEIAELRAELRRLKSAGDLLAAAVLGHDSGPPGVDPRVAANAWAAARATKPQGDSDE